MGGGSWTNTSWRSYADTNTVGKSQADIFKSTTIDPGLSAHNFNGGIRESVDGDDNPRSTAIALFSDVTGSMGITAEAIIRRLDVVCENLYDRKPVTNPHILTGAIGDAYTDSSPFQATQFEADIRIAEQTQKLFLERRGGGNGGESYALAWLFAAMQTATDCYDKRGEKGFLFTVGDEPVHGVEEAGTGYAAGVTVAQAKRFLNLDIERDLSAKECLEMAQRKWNVFHIVIETHSSYRAGIEATFGTLMPNSLLWLEDVQYLPELIVSTIEVTAGKDKATVADSWDGGTSLVVASAMRDLAVNANNQAVVAL